MKIKNEFKLTVDSKSVNESFCRVVVTAFASALDPTIEEITDLKTAVSEAVTNSIVHGYAGYCWPSLSPDGTKVMFVAAGKGIYITDLKGCILSQPGKYEAPVWYGNNHIVAMNAKDDGHQYMSSQIVLLSADGKQVQDLTKPESMSMNPAAAISANRVVYNTIDGRLYEMTVTLK